MFFLTKEGKEFFILIGQSNNSSNVTIGYWIENIWNFENVLHQQPIKTLDKISIVRRTSRKILP